MITDEELLRRMRVESRWTESLSASADQWEMIEARRARGERVTIPDAPIAKGTTLLWRLAWPVAAAAAALLAMYVPLQRDTSPRPGVEAGPSPGPAVFAPGLLFGQTTSQPHFATLGASAGERLEPGRWVYAAAVPNQTRPSDTLMVYSVAAADYSGKPAWLVLTGKQLEGKAAIFADSTWMSRDSLMVLEYRTDTLDTSRPLPGNILAVLQGASLSTEWKSSIPILSGTPGSLVHSWMNLRVYGVDEIEVPAGRYSCWRVGFHPNNGFYFWISKEGWPIRQGMSRTDDFAFGEMNLALVRKEP
jgi:hypothetical protein